MLVVELNNSFSQVKNATPEQLKNLRELLSYQPDIRQASFGGYRAQARRYLMDRHGNFPTGLAFKLFDFLLKTKLTFLTKECRIPPNSTKKVLLKPSFGSRVPYPAQTHAVAKAVVSDRGIISMPTGSGKSQVAAMIIAKFSLRTLVVVPTLGIKNQMRENLEAIFGKTKHIVVENIDSKSLTKHTDFDLLIIDEGHHAAARTYQKLNQTAWKGIFHRFFLTATPYRNVEHEQLLLKAVAGEVIYSLSYREAVDFGQIVPVEAFVVDIPKKHVDGNTWAQVYSELVVNHKERNEKIAGILMSLDAVDKSSLCLVKEIKHGRILSDLTGFPFVCGEDEESKAFIDQFNAGKIKTLIGTTGVVGEGVDTRPAEYVLVAGLGKAKSAFQQQVGRSLRRHGDKDSGKIILFRDRSHKFTIRHYNEQAKIMREEYGISPEKLEV